MKKVLFLVLALVLLVGSCLSLTSCGSLDYLNDFIHLKCDFSDEWTCDETYHWHKCTSESCDKVADNAEHIWDDGAITTVATQEEDGVKTFTCSVCNHTKTEKVEFTGFSEEEWNAIFDYENFVNFAYKEVAVTKGSGVSVDSEMVYKFSEKAAWVQVTMAGQTESTYAPDKESAIEARHTLVDSIKSITPYASYEYDPETKTYKAIKPIEIAATGEDTTDVTLTFSEGKLVKIEYSVELVVNGIKFTTTSTVTLTEYGSVVILK